MYFKILLSLFILFFSALDSFAEHYYTSSNVYYATGPIDAASSATITFDRCTGLLTKLNLINSIAPGFYANTYKSYVVEEDGSSRLRQTLSVNAHSVFGVESFGECCPVGEIYDSETNECVVPNPCDAPGQYTEVQCSESYPGAAYDNDDCSCISPDCAVQHAALVSSCNPLPVENWSNATCLGSCNLPSCQDGYESCLSSCGSVGVDNYECRENGDTLIDSCVCKVSDDTPPLAPLVPLPDPGGVLDPGIQPPSDGGIDPITLDPPVVPSENPSPSSDPPVDESATWLKPIKENLDDLKVHVGGLASDTRAGLKNDVVSIGKLDVIAKNMASIANNQGQNSGKLSAIASNTGSTVEGLNRVVDAIGKIDNSGPSNAIVKGTAALPGFNVYDSTVEGLEEDTFFSAVSDFITSGLPLVGFIQGTSLSVSGADPSLNAVLWGKTIEFRIDQYESILNKMGLVLVFCTSVAGFMIIIGRW